MQGLEHSKTENKCKDLPIKLQRSLRNIRTPYVFFTGIAVSRTFYFCFTAPVLLARKVIFA